MPCAPVQLNLPSGPGGIALPGFGQAFAFNLGDLNPFPDGFPEDLMDLFDKLQMLLPSGPVKPSLNLNFGKDIFDAIMKLMDHMFPFLMLYKFFLPLLNLIICILEVLCSLTNPFKLRKSIRRLFRNCLPAFLNLFPIFALIIMIISLLLLLLALIKYLISQILKTIELILRNIRMLQKAYQHASAGNVLAIAKKLGLALCDFQNLFTLLALFSLIIQVIKDMLSVAFAIPPCEESDNDGCCTPDVCPDIVKTNYLRSTGTFQYYNQVTAQNSLSSIFPGVPSTFSNLNFDIRRESFQFFDDEQALIEEFRNIYDAYDVVGYNPKPVFFPTDSSYNANTAPKQAAYTIDLKMFYNPAAWGRPGSARYIRFNDCIMTAVPSPNLYNFDNSVSTKPKGVVVLAGGAGYEDDGVTRLPAYASDGVTVLANLNGTLENFIHMAPRYATNPLLLDTDGYAFKDVEYIFKPVFETLLNKQLVTSGCDPEIALDKNFINNVFAGDIAIKTALVNDTILGNNFPDPNATIMCLQSALDGLRADMSVMGVANFQTIALLCLDDLNSKTVDSLSKFIGIAIDPCQSDFKIDPKVQFTTKPIKISVTLNDRNKLPVANNLPPEVAATVISKLKADASFGTVGPFTYDGYGVFNADINSDLEGKGVLLVSYDNNVFCTNTIPTDLNIDPTHDLKSLDYSFVYTMTNKSAKNNTGTGDADGAPRRDEPDVSRDNSGGM